jgi:anti-sigma factor RsiW
MNCEELRENLAAWLDGELDTPRADAASRHAASCAACAARADALRKTVEACRTWADAEPPAGLAWRAARAAGPVRVRARVWRMGLAAAAAVALLAAGLLIFRTEAPKGPAVASSGNGLLMETIAEAVATNDFERIERDDVWGVLVGRETTLPPDLAEVVVYAESGAI